MGPSTPSRSITPQDASLKHEHCFRLLFENSLEPMAIFELVRGEDGKPHDFLLQELNPAAVALAGLPREKLIGQRLSSHCSQPNLASFCSLVRPLLNESKRQQGELSLPGSQRTFSVSTFPLEGDFIAVNAIELTSGKQAEQNNELAQTLARQQDELLERLIRDAPFAIAVHDGPEHRYSLVNPAYSEMARPKGSLIGRSLAEAWHDNSAAFAKILDQVYQTGVEAHGVDVAFSITGENNPQTVYLTFTVTPRLNEQGEVQGLIVLASNTTEDVRMRQQAEFEHSRLEALFQSAPVGIVLIDAENRLQRANPIAVQMLGHALQYNEPLENLPSVETFSTGGKLLSPTEIPIFRSLREGETLTNVELRIRRNDGSEIDVMTSTAPVRNLHNRVIGAVGVFLDISLQKEIEQERTRVAAQMEVHRHLTQSREMERVQIARHLHEGLLQELIGLQFSIEEALEENDKERRLNQMRLIQRTLSRDIRELRDYSYDLRPPSLSPFGLEKAIRSHADNFAEKYPDLEIHLDLLPDGQMLPEPVRLVLFRVYQEVLLNVARHSHATNVYIHFVFNRREARLEIKDNGSGFSVPTSWVEAARQGRMGLVGVLERVESVGGSVEINSESGDGTSVMVRVPLGAANP